MSSRRSRDDWTRVGLERLGEVGVDKLRVDELAKTLGVTKGSFYWHFKGRPELLTAILQDWQTHNTDHIIAQVDVAGTAPSDRALHLWEILVSKTSGMEAELAIRDWGRRDSDVASVIGQVDTRRMQYVESLLAGLHVPPSEIPARTLLLYSLLFGTYLIAATTDDDVRQQTITNALSLLLAPGDAEHPDKP